MLPRAPVLTTAPVHVVRVLCDLSASIFDTNG